MSNFDFDFELRLKKNMGEKTLESTLMGYSAAYPTGAERIADYKRIHFAVMAIESGARKLGMAGVYE